MSFTGLGDLAQNLMLRRQSGALQTDLKRVTQELTTGERADTGNAVRGDYALIASLDRALARADAFEQVRDRVGPELDAAQTTLGRIQSRVLDLGTSLISDNVLQSGEELTQTVADVRPALDEVVGLLNTNVGGRSLFAGVESRSAALASVETILTTLATDTAAAVTQADFETAVDDWFFAPGGGFELIAYQGGAAQAEATRISETETVTPQITAEDQAFRQVLRDLSVMALVADGRFETEPEIRGALVQNASENLLNANADLIEIAAGIGRQQEKLEQTQASAAAERFAQIEMRSNLVSVDPFDAAAELEQLRTQIETLYTITARTSRLSLTEYL